MVGHAEIGAAIKALMKQRHCVQVVPQRTNGATMYSNRC
jgi:hypothetical protein